jgi:putative nucleotidyltransferase with HDIG domain
LKEMDKQKEQIESDLRILNRKANQLKISDIKHSDEGEIPSSDILFLANTAMKLVELSPEEDIYEFVGQQLQKLTESSIIVISSFDEASNSFCVRSVIGASKDIDIFRELLRKNPVGVTASLRKEARIGLTKGKLMKVPGGLYEFALGEIPEAICHEIERRIDLGDIYSMGFSCKGKLFGSAAILTHKETKLTSPSVLETFVSQSSVAIQRWQSDQALQQAHDQLEKQVAKRTEELTKANETLKAEIAVRQQAERNLTQTTKKLLNSLEGTIQAIARMVEIRDPYTAGHQRRVTQLACAIARRMNFSEGQINSLHLAGIIHDVGKIQVPAEILANPDGLSEAEFSIIKTHPLAGYEILKTIEFPWPVAKIIYQHHERMDGSGYPQGLSGEDILLEARVLAVADVVEAMSSHRPYRPALGIDKALSEITQKKGIFYDASVVDACLLLFEQESFKFE